MTRFLWQVTKTSNLLTSAGVTHLTSFASGFYPEPNSIDFQFIFAHASVEDNVTIYMFILLSFLFYFLGMAWATLQDKKDLESVSDLGALMALKNNV